MNDVFLPQGYTLHDRADPVAAHAYLTRSYWAKDRSLATVERSLEGSFTVSVRHSGEQVAMARIISDYATFAYLADVYVLEEHRGMGLSKAMLRYIHDHPRLKDLGRWLLTTSNAHALYEKFGWAQHPNPERLMIRQFHEGHGA